jgi:hypothetical protein
MQIVVGLGCKQFGCALTLLVCDWRRQVEVGLGLKPLFPVLACRAIAGTIAAAGVNVVDDVIGAVVNAPVSVKRKLRSRPDSVIVVDDTATVNATAGQCTGYCAYKCKGEDGSYECCQRCWRSKQFNG